jgi:regulatory protein YycI of two-component signal transduction system YycFG
MKKLLSLFIVIFLFSNITFAKDFFNSCNELDSFKDARKKALTQTLSIMYGYLKSISYIIGNKNGFLSIDQRLKNE